MIGAKLLDHNPRSCWIEELELFSQQSYQTEHDFYNPLKFSPENKSLVYFLERIEDSNVYKD